MSQKGNPPLLLKANLKQLRLPAMLAEFEALAREAGQMNQNYEQYLLRLSEWHQIFQGERDDSGAAGSPDAPQSHLRDERRKLPLPRVDERKASEGRRTGEKLKSRRAQQNGKSNGTHSGGCTSAAAQDLGRVLRAAYPVQIQVGPNSMPTWAPFPRRSPAVAF